jgi:hypothetical protein
MKVISRIVPRDFVSNYEIGGSWVIVFSDDFDRPDGGLGSNYLENDSEFPSLTIVSGKACGDIHSIGIYKDPIIASKVSIYFEFTAASNEGFEAHGIGIISFMPTIINTYYLIRI